MRAFVAWSTLALTLCLAGAASALTPTSTRVSPLPVQDLALTDRSIAYVADPPRNLHCARIGYWNVRTRQAFTVDSKELCEDEASTGQGVWDVSVATRRLVWLTYTGGNFREWFLWTATTTRRTPRRLRLVSRDVDAPAPVVLGPGTADGVPYAVDGEIVYLGDDGRALFRTTVGSPVRALAARRSSNPNAASLAALLASDEIVALTRSGNEVLRRPVPAGVTAIAFDDRSRIAYQLGRVVQVLGRGAVTLPAGARMDDAAQGRILWTRGGDLGATTISTGRSVRLVDGSHARPALGRLEPFGLAWAQGVVVSWRAGRVP